MCWIFIATCELSLVAVNKGYSLVAVPGLLVAVASLSLSFFLNENLTFKRILFIGLFLAALGLLCCSSFSLVAESRGCPLVTVLGFLVAVASLVAERRL